MTTTPEPITRQQSNTFKPRLVRTSQKSPELNYYTDFPWEENSASLAKYENAFKSGITFFVRPKTTF